jgi:Uma2 family endonuclease
MKVATMETLTLNANRRILTEKQFLYLCVQNRDLRFERDKKGNILIMSPAFSVTGKYNAYISAKLWNWNNKYKLGYVFDSSAGFTLPNGAMRSPDASWIAKKRWEKIPQYDRERFAHICPDFVIELRSKSDSLQQLQEKMKEWIENGCRLGWLIDPVQEKVFIYRANNENSVINSFRVKLSGEDVLPNFKLDLSKMK